MTDRRKRHYLPLSFIHTIYSTRYKYFLEELTKQLLGIIHCEPQTVLGGLTMHLLIANFLYYIHVYARNYENRLAVDKVIAITKGWPFCGSQCIEK